MTFISTMAKRGFIQDTTADLPILEGLGKITAYIGFDLTAPSLHVGSLIQLMVLRWLSRTGHRPIVLMGEATTRIGDPSDKDTQRPMLDRQTISDNYDAIEAIIRRIVPGADFVSNADWFGDDPSYMDFLSEYGPHFTINRMLTMDSVKRRLARQQPLTYLEFSYMLLQAVDFRQLASVLGCNMQIGGSDQWGNILNGVELIRRKDGRTVHAFTTPLLTDSQGNKIGKTSGKPVWLDADMTSVYDFYQYWRNVDDSDVIRFLKLFTELDIGDDIISQNINDSKKILATEVTKIVHGTEATIRAMMKAEGDDSALDVLHVKHGSRLVDVMVGVGFAESKAAARRLIAGNAVMLSAKKIGSDDTIVVEDCVLRVGKKNRIAIKVS